ncbi:DUF262 domain-containing protein [Hydrocarboniclastica marina]|uniref:DUF262 domain-containing protein n=1 Tax=Hydrocarboniclastica marina TaxID=2259620 RepID=A0A4P7XEM0_9ALTE|nr:DUF262 domain-containing protein [Hydrocarboniclastica marina]QCF25348.1 DUF262 domain-containing protein [Hydrocarboniclastica marina]
MNEIDEKSVETEEDELFFDDEYDQQPPSDIVAYNELRSCADLFRMYDKEILDITPDFQRDSVWQSAAQTRFIDSLIKQLPIPSMCFSLDYKTQKWQVIDGLQRMTAIIRFMTDKEWRLSNLEDIDKRLSGTKVSSLRDESSPNHILYQSLENLTLPITVLRCDHSKKTHMEYLFTIFHRLNTGGMRLNNQEIRNCIYSGTFNTMLKEINENKYWRKINKLGDKEDQRFKHVELILRFFAFYDDLKSYKGILSKFLNEYMRKNRNPEIDFIDEKLKLFERTVVLINEKIINENDKIGSSTLEALLVGVASNIDHLEKLEREDLRDRFEDLKSSRSLSTDYLSGGVAKKEKVEARINESLRVFSR